MRALGWVLSRVPFPEGRVFDGLWVALVAIQDRHYLASRRRKME